MKKRIFTFVLLCTACVAFSESLQFHFVPAFDDEIIKIDYDIPDIFEEFTLAEEFQQEVSVSRSFKMTFNGAQGECQFLFYVDTGVSEENFQTEVRFWDSLILRNIVGEAQHTPLKYYESETKNFNADLFGMCMIFNPSSEFARGYKFGCVETAFRKGMGICYRVFLSNDRAFFGITKENKVNPKADFFKYHGTWWFDTPDYKVEKGSPDL